MAKTRWWSRVDADEADTTIDLTDDSTSAAAEALKATSDAVGAHLGTQLGRLRREADVRDGELVRALEGVAASYERVADQLEQNRRMQRLLAEAMVRIERRLTALERGRSPQDTPPNGQRIIGGTITPAEPGGGATEGQHATGSAAAPPRPGG